VLQIECNEGIWYIRTIMFEYGAKSDAEGRQALRAAYWRGAGVLSAVVGMLCLFSGQTLLGLANLVLAACLGIHTLGKRRASDFSLRIK
jgi:hypothetical protein